MAKKCNDQSKPPSNDKKKQEHEYAETSNLNNNKKRIHVNKDDSQQSIDQITPLYHQQLPNEIIYMILNHLLDNQQQENQQPHEHHQQQRRLLIELTLVNKQLHGIVNPLIWKTLYFESCHYGADNMGRFLKSIRSASSNERRTTLGHYIRDLHIGGYQWTDTYLSQLVPYLSQLTHLSIQYTKVSDTIIRRLIRRCGPQLTSFKIKATTLLDVSFKAIGQHCSHQLLDLDISVHHLQTPESLDWLLACPLERLTLCCYETPIDDTLMTILKEFNHLKYLFLIHLQANIVDFFRLVTTTTSPSPFWPQLTHIVLDTCEQVTDAMLIDFIKSRPQLQHIQLFSPKQLTDASLDAMAKWLPGLTSVHWRGNDNISTNGIRRLIQKCQQLDNLTFDYCRDVWTNRFPEVGLVPYDNPMAIYGVIPFSHWNLGAKLYQVRLGRHTIDMIRQYWNLNSGKTF